MSLNERDGGDTSVANNDGGNGGLRIKSRLEHEGENARVLISAAWMSKKLQACLKHYENKRVALTQLGLSQLQVHYPTMCIQALSWVKATTLFLQ